MADEVVTQTLSKKDVKLSSRSNVIPITSLSDLGTIVAEIQNQLSTLIGKLDNDVRPEFKALMEGYINKANETEEIKANLNSITSKHEELKSEISQLRNTNRNLIQELQIAREMLKKLEEDINTFHITSTKNEEDYKNKISNLTNENQKYEDQVIQLETKINELKENQDSMKQEHTEQSFKLRQNEQELMIERDRLKKQTKGFEILLKEQQEQIEFKTKEAEYKEALLNQLIKKTTIDKLTNQESNLHEDNENQLKKKKSWFLKGF